MSVVAIGNQRENVAMVIPKEVKDIITQSPITTVLRRTCMYMHVYMYMNMYISPCQHL